MLLQGSIDYIVSTMNTTNPLLIKVWENQEDAVRFLHDYPLVKTMAIYGKEIQLTFTGDGEQEAELLEALIQRGIRIASFGRKKDNLETIYMSLTAQG
jgi:ABC-2 type transport system ATP-binding protein